MSTRQYIGARYVPKFFDWDGSAEWRSGIAYEALTIVTRNGNSYTSKIPVPSNIGAPESNPTYWVSTGMFNEQVESIREGLISVQGDVETLDGRVDTAESDINAVEGRVDTAEGDIDTLEGRAQDIEDDIDAINDAIGDMRKPINMKNCIFIGDSYGSRENNWITPLIAKLGLSSGEYDVMAVGSTGFAYTHEGSNFRTMLTALHNRETSEFIENVTHIIVCGGANDTLSTSQEIGAAIREFCSMANTYYPNSMVYIGFIGCTTTSNKIRDYANTCVVYKDIADAKFVYLNNVEYTLHKRYYIESDGVHPTELGCMRLAYNIWCALLTGSCSVKYFLERATVGDGGLGRKITEVIENGEYHLFVNNYLHFEYNPAVTITNVMTQIVADLGVGLAVGSHYEDCNQAVPIILYEAGGVSHMVYGTVCLYANKLEVRFYGNQVFSYNAIRFDIPQINISFPTLYC